jgi:hypothetical protein
MTGYTSMTAAEHEQDAGAWARLAYAARDKEWLTHSTDAPMKFIRNCQNFAAMHMQDAQRMRECGRK